MKTDHPIYLFLRSGPEAFRVLSGGLELVEANATTLRRQLTRRFGPLQPWAAQRIVAAPEAQLETWLEGIFDATSVEDLIGGEERY